MKKPILVMLVGESGAGKTTFVKSMGCEENWYESSLAIVKELKKQKKEINHDTIHKLASIKYGEDPYWQVSKIIRELNKKGFLILDGPRRLKEVERLIKLSPRTLIIKISTHQDKRLENLKNRDKVNLIEYNRIARDENKQTDLGKIMDLAHLEIINDGNYELIRKKALQMKSMIIKNAEKSVRRKQPLHDTGIKK